MRLGRFLVVCCVFWLGIQASMASIAFPDSLFTEHKSGPHFVFNFDTRYTLFGNNPARISGLKAGLEWRNRLRTGLGFYALSTPLKTRLPITTPDQQAIEAQVKFRYVAVYGEYVLLKNKKWEASLPVQLGFGSTLNVYQDASGNVQRTTKVPLWLIEPSVSGHYKVFPWVGIGAGAGYRQMLTHTNRESDKLNGPIYYLKVKLFTGELYRLFKARYCLVPAE